MIGKSEEKLFKKCSGGFSRKRNLNKIRLRKPGRIIGAGKASAGR